MQVSAPDFFVPMKQKIKIALVEDAQLMREGTALLLSDFPEFEVHQAANGKEFIRSLKLYEPDVVLLDVEMPEMDGYETALYLNKHYPNLKVIILTLHDEKELAFQLIRRGVRGFLDKDVNIAIVVEAIHAVLGSQGYYYNQHINPTLVEQALKQEQKPTKQLTPREDEVLSLICKGHSTRRIAEILHISPKTVEGHISSIKKKTGKKNTAGLIFYYLNRGGWRSFTNYSRKKTQ